MKPKRIFWTVVLLVVGFSLILALWRTLHSKTNEKPYENIEDYLQEDNYPFNDPSFDERQTTFTSADLSLWIRKKGVPMGLSDTSSIEISEAGQITLRTSVSDPTALVTQFEEAKAYSAVLSLIKDREIVIRFTFKSDEKGNVDYDISNLSVSGVAVDGGMVKPYLSSLELFSNLSQIPFSSLSFATDRLSFAEGVPQTLIG